MMNTYTYQFECTCPSDGESISYTIQLTSPQMIKVEEIRSKCDAYDVGYQEDIAEDLHQKFGCHVYVEATHQGVIIQTELE